MMPAEGWIQVQYEGTDDFLVQGLREGDNLAAQQLIDTYSAPLYRYLLRRCSCDEDASDVLSMVFQKVVASIHTYDPARGSFKNWLYEVAQSCRADFYRRWGGVIAGELPPDDLIRSEWGPTVYYDSYPETRAWQYASHQDEGEGPEESKIIAAVQEVLTSMPKRYAEVLQLEQTDLTREEIAILMGITRDHLRVLLSRAIACFKRLAQQNLVLAEWLDRAEPLPQEEAPRRRGRRKAFAEL